MAVPSQDGTALGGKIRIVLNQVEYRRNRFRASRTRWRAYPPGILRIILVERVVRYPNR